MISLGVDIGGTGCKCVAFDNNGCQIAVSYTEYPIPSGTVNLPAELLYDSVFHVISECCKLCNRNEVSVITVSSFGESFVALDSNGKAITDILMYFGNSESEEFDRLMGHASDLFMKITQLLPDASYSLSKMLYTQKIADRPVWKYLFIAGFICYRLCGEACSDVSLACRSLLYDVTLGGWSQTLISSCGIDAATLPRIVPTGTKIGTILPELAEKLELPKDTAIVIGAHDQIVNALGAGVVDSGDAVDTSGTCECITPLFKNIPSSQDFVLNNFACVPYIGNSGYVTYAYNISAGSVVRWYRDLLSKYLSDEAKALNCSIYDILNNECPKETSDLIVLPFFQGMGGTPQVNAGAQGTIFGLTTQTRLPDIYRAILEGITFEMRYNIETLKQNGVFFKKLFACGGGAKSKAWLQIKADILGYDIRPVMAEETGAMGSAILGFSAITGESPFEIAKRFVHYAPAITPDKENKNTYDKKYKQYLRLRELLY